MLRIDYDQILKRLQPNARYAAFREGALLGLPQPGLPHVVALSRDAATEPSRN
jgi:hypothetical protein